MMIARKLETVTVAIATLIAIIIGILDLAGALDNVGWLRDRIPVLTLLVVGALAAHLIIEQALAERKQSGILHSAVDQAVAALSGIEAREFESRADFWLYAAKRIREAKSSIDDLTWGEVLPTTRTQKDKVAYGAYRREIELASNGKRPNQGKIYREIMSFPNDMRLRRVVPLLDRKYPNYELRYFDYDHSGTPPLLQFYVFDKVEVLASLAPLTGSPADSRYMTFRSRQLADLMTDYFEAAWRGAIILKDFDLIKWDILDDIARRLGWKDLRQPTSGDGSTNP
jgi:hypothetical protein